MTEAFSREASLRQVLAMLRARWLLVAALALPVLLVSWGYAVTLPPAHTATVILSFAPEQGDDPGPSFSRLLPRYEITATTQQALTRAEQEAGLPSGSLGDAVSAELPGDRLELTLTVTTPVEEASVVAARSLADTVSRVAAGDPLVSVWTAREPQSTGNETPERRAIALVAGLLLAPLPGAVLALVLEGSRPRVRLPDDLHAAGVPVLQSFPLRPRAGRAAARGSATPGAKRFVRLWLLVTGALDRAPSGPPDPSPDVMVTSIDGHDDDADRVVEGLSQAGESVRPQLEPWQTYATFRTASWLPAVAPAVAATAARDGSAAPSGSSPAPEQPCLLVLRTGLPQDEVHAAAELVRHQGGRVLGSVLLTR